MEVKTKRTYLRFILMPLLFALTCVGVFAQANSSVTGIVTDQSGAAVAGAKVVLTDPATGATGRGSIASRAAMACIQVILGL